MKETSASGYRSFVALALTGTAGFVDALGYLLLSGVYTANMSGNTVLIGVHAADGDLSQVALYAATIGTFVLGLVVGGAALKLLERSGFRRLIAFAMALEVLSLAALVALDEYALPYRAPVRDAAWQLYALVAIAAVAMGIQNTSLRTAGVLTVYTTHVTGSVTKFSEDAIEWLFGSRGGAGKADRRARARAALFSFGLWLAFLLGALAAAVAARRFGMRGAVAPIAVVLLVLALDCIAPLRRDRRSQM